MSQQEQGRFAEAAALARQALTRLESAAGPDHPDVALTLNNWAVLCKAQGKYDQAEALYQRALAIFETRLPAGHPHRAACLANYADLLQQYRARSRPGRPARAHLGAHQSSASLKSGNGSPCPLTTYSICA